MNPKIAISTKNKFYKLVLCYLLIFSKDASAHGNFHLGEALLALLIFMLPGCLIGGLIFLVYTKFIRKNVSSENEHESSSPSIWIWLIVGGLLSLPVWYLLLDYSQKKSRENSNNNSEIIEKIQIAACSNQLDQVKVLVPLLKRSSGGYNGKIQSCIENDILVPRMYAALFAGQANISGVKKGDSSPNSTRNMSYCAYLEMIYKSKSQNIFIEALDSGLPMVCKGFEYSLANAALLPNPTLSTQNKIERLQILSAAGAKLNQPAHIETAERQNNQELLLWLKTQKKPR